MNIIKGGVNVKAFLHLLCILIRGNKCASYQELCVCKLVGRKSLFCDGKTMKFKRYPIGTKKY